MPLKPVLCILLVRACDYNGNPLWPSLLFECHIDAIGKAWLELLKKLCGKCRTSFPKLSFLNFVPSVLIQAIPDVSFGFLKMYLQRQFQLGGYVGEQSMKKHERWYLWKGAKRKSLILWNIRESCIERNVSNWHFQYWTGCGICSWSTAHIHCAKLAWPVGKYLKEAVWCCRDVIKLIAGFFVVISSSSWVTTNQINGHSSAKRSWVCLVVMNVYNVKSIFNLWYLVYEEPKLLHVTCRSNLLSPD